MLLVIQQVVGIDASHLDAVVEYRKGKEKQQRRIAKSTINPVGRRVKRFVGFREKELA